jgi:hypothetical protein
LIIAAVWVGRCRRAGLKLSGGVQRPCWATNDGSWLRATRHAYDFVIEMYRWIRAKSGSISAKVST